MTGDRLVDHLADPLPERIRCVCDHSLVGVRFACSERATQEDRLCDMCRAGHPLAHSKDVTA